jgi:hypothetical protein
MTGPMTPTYDRSVCQDRELTSKDRPLSRREYKNSRKMAQPPCKEIIAIAIIWVHDNTLCNNEHYEEGRPRPCCPSGGKLSSRH